MRPRVMSGSELRLCLFVGLREFVAHAADDDRGFYSSRYSYRGGRQSAAVHRIHHRHLKHRSDVERGWRSFNGTITSTGLYMAPTAVPNPAQVTVTATSQADSTKSASATVTITTASANRFCECVAQRGYCPKFGTQQFTALENGLPSTAVTWQVNGVTGGNLTVGFISTSGLYVAPSGVPTRSDSSGGSVTTTATVTAISQVNSASARQP